MPLAPGLSHSGGELGVACESDERRGECLDVTDGNEDASPIVLDGLRHAADLRRHDRLSGRHRLEDYHRQSLGSARKTNDVSRSENVRNIGARARHANDCSLAHKRLHVVEFRATSDDDTSHSGFASMRQLNRADEDSRIFFRAKSCDEDCQESVAFYAKSRSHRRRRCGGHDLGDAVLDYPNSIPPVAELQESRNLALGDSYRTIHARPHHSCQSLSMPSPRSPWPEVKMFRRNVGRADFSRDEMTDDMGVGAVRHNNGRSQFVLAQRPDETDDVEPVAHARAPDVDPTESQLLEERTLVNQRQNRDVVASVAKRRNELRPLPLGAARYSDRSRRTESCRLPRLRRTGNEAFDSAAGPGQAAAVRSRAACDTHGSNL